MNWNCDPFLDVLSGPVLVFTWRRPSRRPTRANVCWVITPLSFLLMAAYTLMCRLMPPHDTLESVFFQICLRVYDVEAAILSLIFRSHNTRFVCWSHCCLVTLKVNRRFGTAIFNGNSHIETFARAYATHTDVKVAEYIKKRCRAEYVLANYLLVESSYGKSTFVEAGFDNVIVAPIPPYIPASFGPAASIAKAHPTITLFATRQIKGSEISKILVSRFASELPLATFNFFGEFSAPKPDNVRVISTPLDKASFLHVLSETDCLILPTYEDGGPRVAVEAAALGAYVIGSAMSIVPDLEKVEAGCVVADNTIDGYLSMVRSLDFENLRESRSARSNALRAAYNLDRLRESIATI